MQKRFQKPFSKSVLEEPRRVALMASSSKCLQHAATLTNGLPSSVPCMLCTFVRFGPSLESGLGAAAFLLRALRRGPSVIATAAVLPHRRRRTKRLALCWDTNFGLTRRYMCM